MVAIYIILVLAALFLLIPLFTSRKYTIHRTAIINKPLPAVYDYLRFLKNQKGFNAWLLKDPDIKESFAGIDGQAGFVYNYEGNKDVGAGALELTALEDNRRIAITLRFLKPFKSTSDTVFELEAVNKSQTKIRWTMQGYMKYPMNIALLFINMDKFLGKDMEQSLDNLTRILH